MARTLDQVRALFNEGEIIECVENTLRPELDGTKRRLVKVGRSYATAIPLDGPGAGKEFHMSFPARAASVVHIDDERVTYLLNHRSGGTSGTLRVTLRRVKGGES